MAYIRQAPEPVSVDSALAEFRESRGAEQPGVSDEPETVVADPGNVTQDGPALPGAAGPDPEEVATGTPAAPGSTEPPSAAAARPAEGVYPQTTMGYEYTDAVGGSRHDYPGETSVVLKHTDCGITTRWEPLKERWDNVTFCTVDDALEIRVFSMYHEFFQRGQQQDYNCPAGTRVFDRSEPVGAAWTWRCESQDASIDTKVTVVGFEPVSIGGERVDAVKMHYESTLGGSTSGSQIQDRWIDRTTGAVLRLKSDITAESDSPFGRVSYEEHYTIEMSSLTPRT